MEQFTLKSADVTIDSMRKQHIEAPRAFINGRPSNYDGWEDY